MSKCTLTRSQLWHKHWLKELRTPLERQLCYQHLRIMGVPACLAARARDWTTPHQELIIANIGKKECAL